jgi:4-hydroxy-3-methylbut-2-enyl diphosphate reductase
MKVDIDKKAGFCFGVIKAIKLAESELAENDDLFCLGDIVHNNMEIHRLEQLGLKTITEEEFYKMKNIKVLIRAHGQPPETYQYAEKNNIRLIDATCPVVLNLQKKIRSSCKKYPERNGQVVIFGKSGHAEVIALNGQINNRGIIIESTEDLHKIDYSRPVCLFSQTTRRVEDFYEIAGLIMANMKPGVPVEIKDTICRQVSNRVFWLRAFAKNYDIILFVAGRKSSNGHYLFSICKEANANSHYISALEEIDTSWFEGVKSVGISGATSTPEWLMKAVADHVNKISS